MPISKVKRESDGSRVVFGLATDETLDRDQQIVDADFAAKAMAEWFTDLGAPIRNMHAGNYPPAGKGMDLVREPEGAYIRAKIVEPTAIKLIDEGVYKDFSVGIFDPVVVDDPHAPGGRIIDGWIGEVSLVDLGSNKNAHFALAKRAKRDTPIEALGIGASAITASLAKVVSAGEDRAVAASQWYGAMKRDFDPDVGGGVDRDKLDDSDFVIIENGKRKFPIVTPSDVSDAVSSWGRYKGPVTFAQFRKKLIRLARRKGPAFVAELPESWNVKKGKKMGQKASEQVPVQELPEGAEACGDCEGSGKMDGADCAKCEGKGYTTKSRESATKASALAAAQHAREVVIAAQMASDVAGAALKSAARLAKKGPKIDDADEDVNEAIGDLMNDVQEAAAAQEEDDEGGDDKPTDSEVDQAITGVGVAVGDLAAAQARDVAADISKPKGKKSKKSKADPFPGAAPRFGSEERQNDDRYTVKERAEMERKRKAKKGKKSKKSKVPRKGIEEAKYPKPFRKKARKSVAAPVQARAAHDVLCPAFKTADVAAHYPMDQIRRVIDPNWFSQELTALSTGRATKSEVGQAFQALASAQRLAAIDAPKFKKMRDAAADAFANAYPDVHTRPGIINPAQFHRGFLSGATSEEADTTHVDEPAVAPSLSASDFRRPPLTDNETRASLVGGESVTGYGAKDAKKAAKRAAALKRKGSRLFYRNADRDSSASAMALLHDHIVHHYPGVCPMEAMIPGTEIDSDGQMGSPAEMNAKEPDINPFPSPRDEGDSGTVRPVGKKSKQSKSKKAKAKRQRKTVKAKAAKRAEAKKLERMIAKAQKPLRRRAAKLETQLTKALRAPDQRRTANRGTVNTFAPKADSATELKRREALGRVAALKTRMADRNSTVAQAAQEQLMSQMTPEQFARMVAND